ncbi:hypothetical protein EJ04DRAFT_2933 [Polyplosphaeria fusca]|uniref:Uncharacterized protein n=1 Tax=Polyplosphaeria fusca TaxID=682080 RepID=A0A9P4V979_9PLEO|nr:hypothetical protein EJ04DRAFT_2933 [Polyplosphaeria fusca]
MRTSRTQINCPRIRHLPSKQDTAETRQPNHDSSFGSRVTTGLRAIWILYCTLRLLGMPILLAGTVPLATSGRLSNPEQTPHQLQRLLNSRCRRSIGPVTELQPTASTSGHGCPRIRHFGRSTVEVQ